MPYIAPEYVRRMGQLPDRSGVRLYLLRAALWGPRITIQTNRGRVEDVRQTARPAGWAWCRRFAAAHCFTGLVAEDAAYAHIALDMYAGNVGAPASRRCPVRPRFPSCIAEGLAVSLTLSLREKLAAM